MMERKRNVRNNGELSRFEMDTEAGLAVADYRLNGSTMTIYQMEMPCGCDAAFTGHAS